MQLLLPIWGERTLRGCVEEYLLYKADDLADATLVDYRERAEWLFREFGELAPIESFTFDLLLRTARKYQGILRQVTVKRRFKFLRACLKLAWKRQLIEKLVELPDFRNDGEVRSTLITPGQWKILREHIPSARFRALFDLGFWTGMHMPDLMTIERWHLDVNRPVLDEYGNEVSRGAYWRRNQKYRRCVPAWIPMQREFIDLTAEILSLTGGSRSDKVVGQCWNVIRAWRAASDRAVSDGHDLPRVTPTDLRRSCANMLTGRGYSSEAVRIVLGHACETSNAMGGTAVRPTTASRHYMWSNPGLLQPRPTSK